MVKIAIAGGSGNVAQEVIDGLVATGKHDILLLSRKDAPTSGSPQGVTWIKTNYDDLEQLATTLKGVHTVLSFVVSASDPENTTQKNLIDASIKASVKRFAPSEWATSSFEHMRWYAGKATIREYLKEINKDKKVLEYSLFVPGIFTNYWTRPYPSAKHVHLFENQIDFHGRRALVVDGAEDARITFTTVQDLVNIVARAIEYEGEWPIVGGIKGDELSVREFISLGEKVRGGPFTVEKLNADDLKAGVVNSSWLPHADHPSLPPEQVKASSKIMTAGMMLGISVGALNVSDEWNQLLPDYQFTRAEDFLEEAWRGKP